MRGSGDAAWGYVITMILALFLCYLAVVAAVTLVALVALLFLGWVLTYWLLRAINDRLTDNWVTESEGLLALIIPALLWAGVIWCFIPREWVWWLAANLGWPLHRTWLVVILGSAILGLSWGFLSLLMLESKSDGDQQGVDETGMYQLPGGEHKYLQDEYDLDWLQEGVLLGEDAGNGWHNPTLYL